MKKVLLSAVSLLMIGMLSTGVAWAKPGQGKGTGQESKGIGQEVKETVQELKAAKHFSDVEGHWAKATIEKMAAKGLLQGYEDGTFKPDNSITEAETIVLITRITSKNEDTDKDDSQSVVEATYDFSGVPGWAKKSVQEAVYSGVINLNRFHSEEQATRAKACVELAKAMGLTPVTDYKGSGFTFKDQEMISSEDIGYILALYQNGIIKGTPEGYFNPYNSITRAEMATIMNKVIVNASGGVTQ